MEEFEENGMKETRLGLPNRSKMRNLKQFKDMSDDEFESYWDTKETGIQTNQEFERRISKKIDEFYQDYDIDDLKINDKLTLRALAQAIITLEDLENYSYSARKGGLDTQTIVELSKVGDMMTNLRKDISKMQDDLKITRRVRKGDKEESVIQYIDDLKIKAKKFLHSKQGYIFCPKCKMLLGTVWVAHPEQKKNKITLHCHRVLPDGAKCDEVVSASIAELFERHGANIDDVPDFFK